ncbi:MAG: ATP-dependent RecD-like DNA helicase [Patescibacteria group bacterium]|jgi:exodeoxyribonuclease-5
MTTPAQKLLVSKDQENALSALIAWFEKERLTRQFITLGGYAGTGKTTLISILRNTLHEKNPKLKVGFASYTGKAARVLQTKIKESESFYPQDTIGTIHSLIYTPVINEREEITGWKKKEKIDRELIIIDEASMVDSTIWNHLVSYKIPMIVVGDHGQLPPIAGNFNLMQKPNLLLEQIHRQSAGDPIIDLSIAARTKGVIDVGRYSQYVIKHAKEDTEAGDFLTELLTNYTSETLVLCGYNNTRRRLNRFIRTALGFEDPEPSAGDRVICLRNNHQHQIFNGMLGTIMTIESKDIMWYEADIRMDGEDKNYSGLLYKPQFDALTPFNFTENRKETSIGDLFDFGYALTVHKAQGSQAKRVVLFEERFKKMTESDWKRWLYTAVTRATDELYIF